EDNLANNTILLGCDSASATAQTTVGDLVDFDLICAAAGTSQLNLRDTTDLQGGTFVVDATTFTPTDDVQNNATVTCGGAAQTATNTPQASTNTPAAATDTPSAATNTPSAATNTPAVATNTPAAATNTPAAATDTPS